MKKFLVSFLIILLCAVIALSMAACAGEEEKAPEIKGPKEDVSIYHAEGEGYPELKNQVSWEGINAIPIKTANMDITEARQICVDFFRYAKTATWIPSDNYGIWSDAQIHTDSEPARSMDGGIVYGGLPYISWATGSIYRLMDYIDKDTGVVDMKTAGDVPLAFGNQCANGAYVGFARVINSANYGVTADMVASKGFLRLGDYKYADYLTGYSEGYGTPHIINENGTDTMMESYALLKAGDGIVYWTTAGHVVMIATDAVVVRDEKGKIDPTQSYVTIIDQAVQFVPYQHKDGDRCQIAKNVDAKWTFQQLLSGKYLPFTFAEWTGADPIEETENSITHTGDTITLEQLYQLRVTSNYYIMDLYAEFRNADGVEVYKIASRPIRDAGVKEFRFTKAGDGFECWGSEENLIPGQEYTVKIYMQLGTGERPTLWEGKLVSE